MSIEINKNLQDSILNAVPSNYSNLEKAVFIYQQLCLKTEYALDYFIDEEHVIGEYKNVANLSKVDGIKNKNVVCFTFNAIFLKLLHEAGVIDEQQMFQNDVGISDKLVSIHEPVVLNIDGHNYEFDSTFGILDNNDLALLKYSCNKIQGIDCLYDKEGRQLLDDAIGKVQAETINLDSLSKSYIELKEKEGTLRHLPLSERVEMFLNLVKESCTDYSLKSFTHMLKLKQILFTDQELGQKGISKNIDLVFAKDVKNNGEFKAYLFFNDAGYINDLDYENFDKLRVFEISLKNKQIQEVSIEDMRERCKRKELLTRDNKDKISQQMKMLKKGQPILRAVYDGEPIYDSFQRPVNVAYYVRTHILTGEKEKLSREQVKSMEME